MPAAHDAPADPADPAARLDGALRTAIAAVTGLPAAECDPQIRPSANPQFGDFQANFAMALAKRLGKNPRQLATEVVAAADLASVADKVEVAGPGFVNIHLSGAALAAALDAFDSPALGIAPAAATHAVTIDLCGVNVAKQMQGKCFCALGEFATMAVVTGIERFPQDFRKAVAVTSEK